MRDYAHNFEDNSQSAFPGEIQIKKHGSAWGFAYCYLRGKSYRSADAIEGPNLSRMIKQQHQQPGKIWQEIKTKYGGWIEQGSSSREKDLVNIIKRKQESKNLPESITRGISIISIQELVSRIIDQLGKTNLKMWTDKNENHIIIKGDAIIKVSGASDYLIRVNGRDFKKTEFNQAMAYARKMI